MRCGTAGWAEHCAWDARSHRRELNGPCIPRLRYSPKLLTEIEKNLLGIAIQYHFLRYYSETD